MRILAKAKIILGRVALIACSLLLAEGLLRIIPSPIQNPPLIERGDPDALLGIEHVSSAKAKEHTPCYASDITINSAGWRDTERTTEKAADVKRIAVLGDSFIEGMQVNDDETFTQQLEKTLGTNIEVLNFGMSSIGTVQADILYEHVVTQYDPDIVILAFYSNDVSNNSETLEASDFLTYRDKNGNLTHTRSVSSFYDARKWLRIHSTLFRLLKSVHANVRNAWQNAAEKGASGLPLQYYAYIPPQNDKWREAWQITEETIAQLRDRIEPEKKFMLMPIPGLIEIAPDPDSLINEEFGVDPPDGFDASYVTSRLRNFAQTHAISYIDLRMAFIEYRNTHNLQYPYFYFSCDGHWNAIAQSVAAEIAASALKPVLNPHQ